MAIVPRVRLSLRAWLKPPRHRPALFVVVIVAPAVALAWLESRTIEQDAARARQRVQTRLDGTASRVALERARRLDEIAHALADPAAASGVSLAADSAIVSVTRDAVTERPAGRPNGVDAASRLSGATTTGREELARPALRERSRAGRRLYPGGL